MLARINRLASAQPMAFGAATAAVKTTAADVLVQTAVEGKELRQVDTRRTLTFTLFGGLWMGVGQYTLYCKVFEAMVPGKTPVASAGKAALDQLVHVPLLYFPFFYAVDGFLQGAWARGVDTGVAHIRQKLSTELWPSLKANWSIWLPCSWIGFHFVPPHFRIPYVSVVSMVWTTVFSVLQGRFRAEQAAAAAAGKPPAAATRTSA